MLTRVLRNAILDLKILHYFCSFPPLALRDGRQVVIFYRKTSRPVIRVTNRRASRTPETYFGRRETKFEHITGGGLTIFPYRDMNFSDLSLSGM